MARKQKTIHYIYKTTCVITGRWYIGMHSAYELNDGYMGSGIVLRRSLRKYGKENHILEILEFLPTRELLAEREKEIVDKELINDSLCMNLALGGTGFLNEEHLEKCSKAGNKKFVERLRSDEDFYKIHSERSSITMKATRAKGKIISPNWTGKKHSEETIQLMRELHKGKNVGESNSQYGTCWITKDGINKKIKKEDLDNWKVNGWSQGRK